MNKAIPITISLLLKFTLISCTAVDNTSSDKKSNTITDSSSKEKILIVYFSRAGENYAVGHIRVGNTAVMAGYIRDFTGGAIFEIVPKVPYPDSYEETKTISINEANNNLRPEIKDSIPDLDKYSFVFVGSPIWYNGPPMIMRTFYETYKEKLKTKIVIPFGTHEGSGVSSCTDLLKEYFPDIKTYDAFGLRGRDVRKSRDNVETWLRGIGFAEDKNK